LTLIALICPGRRRKVLLLAFLMPLVLLFTVSLTPRRDGESQIYHHHLDVLKYLHRRFCSGASGPGR
jgi:hypothetical protein